MAQYVLRPLENKGQVRFVADGVRRDVDLRQNFAPPGISVAIPGYHQVHEISIEGEPLVVDNESIHVDRRSPVQPESPPSLGYWLDVVEDCQSARHGRGAFVALVAVAR